EVFSKIKTYRQFRHHGWCGAPGPAFRRGKDGDTGRKQPLVPRGLFRFSVKIGGTHMKKVLGILMAAVMAFSLAACGSTGSESTGSTSEGSQTAEAASTSDIKIGAILVGDETEGYSAAHINGIKEALSNL